MKKKSFSSLSLGKSTVSKFGKAHVKGGRSVACTYGSPSCQSLAGGCGTQPTQGATCADTCTVDSVNLSNCDLTNCLSTGGACA
ncbi:hypothetical protein [Ascidiimonas aurantiaca]|uniref:hypothetical protein n=1 Tax=Ascidiimonas aurantiaca TaxID=1685432 RepID=UPI0030EDB89A